MIVQPKDGGAPRRLVEAHVVEDQRGALVAVREHVDRGLRPGHQHPVDPDQSLRSFSRFHCREHINHPRGQPQLTGRNPATQHPKIPTPESARRIDMHRIEGPIRKGTELVRLSAALYRELALSALKLLPIRRVKALL
jgi:hypothetical protein